MDIRLRKLIENPENAWKSIGAYFISKHNYFIDDIYEKYFYTYDYNREFFADFNEEELFECFLKALSLDAHKELNRDEEINFIEEICVSLLNPQEGDFIVNMGSDVGLLLTKIINKNISTLELVGIEHDSKKAAIADVLIKEMLLIKGDIKYTPSIVNPKHYHDIPIFQSAKKFIACPPLYKQSVSNFNYLQRIDDFEDCIYAAIDFIFMHYDSLAVVAVPDNFLYSAKFEHVRKDMINKRIVSKIVEINRGFNNLVDTPIAILVLKDNCEHFMSLKLDKEMQFIDFANIQSHILDEYNYLKIPYEKLTNTDSFNYSFFKKKLLEDQYSEQDKFIPLGKIAEIIIGSQKTEKQLNISSSNKGLSKKVIRPIDIDDDGLLDVASLKYCDCVFPLNFNKYAHNGDLIITSKSSNIRFAVVENFDENEALVVSGGMFIVKCKEKDLDPYWLKMYLSSNIGQQVLFSALTGDKIKIMTYQSMFDLPIKVVDYITQLEQANEYKANLGKLCKLKKDIHKTRLNLNHLAEEKFTLKTIDLDFDKQEILNIDSNMNKDEENLLVMYYIQNLKNYGENLDDFMSVYNAAGFKKDKNEILDNFKTYDIIRKRDNTPKIAENIANVLSKTEYIIKNPMITMSLNNSILEEGGLQAKNYIISVLKMMGIFTDQEITLASINKTIENVFWATPNIRVKEKYWLIVLNDFTNRRIHVLEIRPNEYDGLFLHKTNDSSLLHLEIIIDATGQYIERKANINLTKNLIKIIKY